MTTREEHPELAKRLVGERLCLDFINTAYQVRETLREMLHSGEDLHAWLQRAEETYQRPLVAESAWSPEYGEKMLPTALALRTALRDLVQSVLDKTPPPAPALETLNATLRANPTYAQLEMVSEGFGETVITAPQENAWLIAIAQDAVDLLSHADLALLRQCEHPTCIRVFYDTTKNHKRRWCVEKCGTPSKAAAYYRRKVARLNHDSRD